MGDLLLRQKAAGHSAQVTSIVTSAKPETGFFFFSCSRDGKVLKWDLTTEFGLSRAKPTLIHKHNHFVQEVALSGDDKQIATASWDGTIMIFTLETEKWVIIQCDSPPLSVSFTCEDQRVVSGHRDGSVRMWNQTGDCLLSLHHADQRASEGGTPVRWVSQVRCSVSPATSHRYMSCGWDGRVCIWEQYPAPGDKPITTTAPIRRSRTRRDEEPKRDIFVHTATEPSFFNSVCLSPDASLLGVSGKEAGGIQLLDFNEMRQIFALECTETVYCVVFSPTRYWLCAALASKVVRIWDLECKAVVLELKYAESWADEQRVEALATTLAWSPNGETLFTGHVDGTIAEWSLSSYMSTWTPPPPEPPVAAVEDWNIPSTSADGEWATEDWNSTPADQADWQSL